MATKKAASTESTAVDETVPVDEAVVTDAPVEVVPVEDAPPVVAVPVADLPAVPSETPPPPPAPVQEVIVVDAPVAPRKKGNRGVGVALALLATLIFTALLVAVAFGLSTAAGGAIGFLTEPQFYFPSVCFFIGLMLVTLVLNRAGWWSHIIGSVVVAAITWFGSASLTLLAAGMVSMNQSEANEVFWAALFSPLLIIAALLAREVAIWTGAILARRGRSLKVRNAEAQEEYEREQAELIPTALS